jgi:hypothetical protein
VLKGMNHDDAPAQYMKNKSGAKPPQQQDVNTPAMPVVWARDNKNADGKVNKTLTTTMGAATDLTNEGLRRLLVNAAYQFTGLEVPAKADVELVGKYEPSFYGFDGHKKGVKPADLLK